MKELGEDSWAAETYDEMKRIAGKKLSHEAPTATLSPTMLVHEAFLRLSDQDSTNYRSKAHFLAVASGMMRRILVDHARARRRQKRGGGAVHVTYDDSLALSKYRESDVLAMEEALDELGQIDERQAKIVEMRFFGGMTIAEVADVLGVSTRTVENEWTLSRAWLRRKLEA